MSSNNKVDKNGLSYFWNKATAYIQEALAYAQDTLILIGNTPMGTVATTITGAIKQLVDKVTQHESDISDLNSNLTKVKSVLLFGGEFEIDFSNSNNTVDLTINLPSDFSTGLGVVIKRSWPKSMWDDADLTICDDKTLGIGGSASTATVTLRSTSHQKYMVTLFLNYIATHA